MTHAHIVSTHAVPTRASPPVPIGAYRMGGMPQPARRERSRWLGVGLVAVLTGIGGVSAYHVMSSNHQELVSVAAHAPSAAQPVPDTAPETAPNTVQPTTPETASAPAPVLAPAPTKPAAEPPRVVPVIERPRPAPDKDKPAVKAAPAAADKAGADKQATPEKGITPPAQTAAPVLDEPPPVKVEAPKPESPKTDSAPAAASSDVSPSVSDNTRIMPLTDT